MKKIIVLTALLCAGVMAGTLKDSRDGKTYKTVKIGNQTWMAENLNYKTDDGSTCYDHDPSNCEKYGRLYIWGAARIACPSGWHLPSKEDFEKLVADNVENRGLSLRSGSWKNGTDKYGFSALPAGYYRKEKFEYLREEAYFWSSTERRSDLVYYLFIADRFLGSKDGVWVNDDFKSTALSVRCLQD